MLTDVVDLLSCPHCHGRLTLRNATVACRHGHTFDVARHGYVNLLPGDAAASTADTGAMVAARAAALSGPLAPLVRQVTGSAAAALPPVDGCVLDLGAGTGRYLAQVLDVLPSRRGLALDLSKHAARRAARAHPRLGAVVCDAWSTLPVCDGVAALALSIFAPRNARELARVLAPDGTLMVVTPTSRHLSPLVDALGLVTVDARKDQRLTSSLGGSFTLFDRHRHAYETAMDADDVAAVVAMGPSARHLDSGALADRIGRLDLSLPVTVSVAVSYYRPMRGPTH